MSKQITSECQFAINMFKATEMAMKNQLDLLEKTIQQRKSFRSLSLLIERTRANEKELRKRTRKGDVAERDEAAASSEYSNINSEQTNQTNQPS